jgi:hypothetical protein
MKKKILYITSLILLVVMPLSMVGITLNAHYCMKRDISYLIKSPEMDCCRQDNQPAAKSVEKHNIDMQSCCHEEEPSAETESCESCDADGNSSAKVESGNTDYSGNSIITGMVCCVNINKDFSNRNTFVISASQNIDFSPAISYEKELVIFNDNFKLYKNISRNIEIITNNPIKKLLRYILHTSSQEDHLILD